MSVSDFLERGALVNPGGVCLRQGAVAITYRDARSWMRRVANTLLAEERGHGCHAAVWCDNDALGFLCSLGVMRAGMAYVPLDTRSAASDHERILAFADVEVLFFQRRYADAVLALRPRLPRLQRLVCLDAALPGVSDLAAWCAGASDGEPSVDVALESTAWLQTGSGTSGDFRMAMMPHRAYHAFVAFCLHWMPDPQAVMLVAAPITHAAGGLAYHVLATGGQLVLIDRAEPRAVLEAIERHRVTKLFLPPTVIYRLLDEPTRAQRDLSSLKFLAWSAAPMSVARLREAIEAFGPVVTQAYGQTEALGISCMRPEEFIIDGHIADDDRLAAAGRPGLPFCRVAIRDAQGCIVGPGVDGEICVRGDQAMTGYYRNPEATAAVLVDGWVHTGDVGHFDDRGYLHIVDRKKDMIISGGFNVYSSEVEQALAAHPAVHEAAVIGVPDDDWGEAVRAVVVKRPATAVTTAELIAWCKQRLGSVKSPKAIDFVDELPRSQRGKILKRVLRDPHWAGRDRQV